MALHRVALVAFAACTGAAEAHGRLTVPRARNGGDNGAAGGGPGAVHAFDAGHTKYQHGICGNAAGTPQRYNMVGDVQATYTSGGVAEFKVVITAHHVGYFEFELCDDAGHLSEACFAKNRLLRQGCECQCPGDSSNANACSECDICRRWWKPVTEGELRQSVTRGYEGLVLEGQGNLRPYEFTMQYAIPAGLKSSRAVLRWHYMTTNSCTSKSSSPEEFWNCADIAIADDTGDVGPDLSFDNTALQSLAVDNLIPAIDAGALKGVNAICPEDADGNLIGVAYGRVYMDLCGEMVDGIFANCRDMTAAGNAGGVGGAGNAGNGGGADCASPPASGILCEHECSDGWFQCHNGLAYTKYVPAGTKCMGSKFVLEAECAGLDTEPVAPTSRPTTPAPATPTPAPTPAVGCSALACGECKGCMWSSEVCYPDIDASYCAMWSCNRWCGGQTGLGLAAQAVNGANLRGTAP